jgi:hypothetical protein
VLQGGDGGDDARQAGDGNGDRTTCRYMAGKVLYIVKNFHFNSSDVRYARLVDRDVCGSLCSQGG